MEDKSKEISASTIISDEKDPEIFQSIVIEDVKYKTRLNKKFLTRKSYVPVDPKKIQAFIPGTIGTIFVKKGKKVKAGQKLLELEAMKMVNTVFAEFDAVILDILVKPGDLVSKNHVLIQLK